MASRRFTDIAKLEYKFTNQKYMHNWPNLLPITVTDSWDCVIDIGADQIRNIISTPQSATASESSNMLK